MSKLDSNDDFKNDIYFAVTLFALAGIGIGGILLLVQSLASGG